MEDKIIRLNIGGQYFQTTRTTLLNGGDNFFSALLNNPEIAVKDKDGCYFVDRNGHYFAAILDFLRSGELLVNSSFNLNQILREAEFYCIDISSALSPFREGMYLEPTSSEGSMIVIEKDPSLLQYVGMTGVIDGNKLFFQKKCKIIHSSPPMIKLKIPEFNINLRIIPENSNSFTFHKDDDHHHSNNNNIVDHQHQHHNNALIKIMQSKLWDYSRILTWKSGIDLHCKFPLPLNTYFVYSNANNRKKFKVWFVEDDGSSDIQMWQSDSLLSSWVNTKVFNDQLIMYYNRSTPLGLIKISGAVIFLISGTTEETFSVYALKRFAPDQQLPQLNLNN